MTRPTSDAERLPRFTGMGALRSGKSFYVAIVDLCEIMKTWERGSRVGTNLRADIRELREYLESPLD